MNTRGSEVEILIALEADAWEEGEQPLLPKWETSACKRPLSFIRNARHILVLPAVPWQALKSLSACG